MHSTRISFLSALAVALLMSGNARAQDSHERQARTSRLAASASHAGDSPFDPPAATDSTFVVDQSAGLDTGCVFRGHGPLIFSIPVTRVVASQPDKLQALKAQRMIAPMAELRMPAFDVDIDTPVDPPEKPEFDRVFFNGHVVPTEFLTGENDIWKENSFQIPVEWINFPDDPGEGHTVTAADNTVEIDIDTANTAEDWCTEIDWASLSIQAARPIVMVHGIFSSGDTWSAEWVRELDDAGLPNTNELNMGDLDSITANAGKIAAVVAASRARWGVDKVNLVAHSKGGIDSRQYVEGHDDVDRLIQIGTPNAGSPLADFAQETALELLGPLGTILANGLAGPAGVELTTPVMATYNLFHHNNPKVLYTSLAGDYDPQCLLCRPECLGLAISGIPGDSIVPVSSVFTLGYAEHLTYASAGDNKQATHLGQTSSPDIYALLRSRATALASDSSPDAARLRGGEEEAAAAPPAATRTGTAAGSLAQGEKATQRIPIDGSGQVSFSLFYPSGRVNLVLTSPSGRRFNPTNTGGSSGVTHTRSAIAGGFIEIYAFPTAEPGPWTVDVTAESVTDPSGKVAYAVAAWLAAPAIQLTGGFLESAIHAGDPLVLTATVTSKGSPELGATVDAVVSLPDGTMRQVALHDDGLGGDAKARDGVYTGQLAATSHPGSYRVAFRATGTSPQFSREAFGLATVSASTASLRGLRDRGLDSNGDGLFEKLVVDVDLAITHPGAYRLVATLTDSAGHQQPASVQANLGTGNSTLSLEFDGQTIFADRTDGPYTISRLRLAEESGEDLLPVALTTAPQLTATYGFRQFQHPPISLTGHGTSMGVDTNGNHLFNRLVVNLEVEVDAGGLYNWSARLVDRNGTEIGFAAGSAELVQGTNTISLVYQGRPIGRNQVDGPFNVVDLLLFGAGRSQVVNNAFTTRPFPASRFEGGSTITLGVALNPAVLSPPNHQLKTVTARITVGGTTDPHPVVTLVSIVSSEPDHGLGGGDVAGDIQGAKPGTDDRSFLLRAESGPQGKGRTYTVVYKVQDKTGATATATATATVPASGHR